MPARRAAQVRLTCRILPFSTSCRWRRTRARGRQFDHGRAQYRQLVILIARFLRYFNETTAFVLEFAGDRRLDEKYVAFRIMPADFAGRAAKKAVIPHPVGELMCQPRASLRPVIVSTGGTDHQRELR